MGISNKKGGMTIADKRDVNNYSPPMGPKNIKDGNGPGLHGDNYGCCGSQGSYSTSAQSSGAPGQRGGDGPRMSGSQGKR